MKQPNKTARSHFSSLIVVGAMAGLAASQWAQAAGDTPASATAHCDGIQQDRAACLREAAAARVEARRGGLVSPAPDAAQANAVARCQAQPAHERAACEDRVRGTGNSHTSGSVLGGGVIRETVTPLPAPVTSPEVTPAPSR